MLGRVVLRLGQRLVFGLGNNRQRGKSIVQLHLKAKSLDSKMSSEGQETVIPEKAQFYNIAGKSKGLEMHSFGPLHCRRLAAFDFDQTVVDDNTDTYLRDRLLGDKLSENASEIMHKGGWTAYMAEVFRLIHKHSIAPDKIRDTIRSIPEVPGFVRLIKRLRQCYDFDLIVISDANTIFIEEWLQAHNVLGCFDKVFSNPAHFEPDGLLSIRPYHHQTDCRLSAHNMCKGKILEHYMMEQNLRHNVRYANVVYVGDGNNDICPVLRLRSCDVACARKGYSMEKNLKKNGDKMKMHAQLLHWCNGFDLLHQLETVLELADPKEK